MPGLGKKSADVIDLTPVGWQSLRDELYLLVDDISDCVGVEFVQRDRVEEIVNSCMEDTLDVGRYRLNREDLIKRLYTLFDKRMYLEIPQDTVNLFKPLAIFDADQDCFNPKEAEEMKFILSVIGDACNQCAEMEIENESEDESEDEGEGGDDDADTDDEGDE